MEHGADCFEFFGEVCLGLVVEDADALGDIELGAQFGGGPFCDVQEACVFGWRVTLGAFGDVGGDGNGGTRHLIAEPVVAAVFQNFVDPDGDPACPLPDAAYPPP